MSMTESEAIEWLAEDTSPTLIHIAEMKKENPMVYINEAVKVACDALSEIQQYRAIGTVSEFRELKEKAIKKVEKCKDKYYCMCGCPVEIMLDGITLKPIGGQVYCDQCGAKLDWNEFVEKGE